MDGPDTDILYTPRGFPVVTWMMSPLPSQPVRTEHPCGHASHYSLPQTQYTVHVVYVALIHFDKCTPLCAFTIDIWSGRSVYAHTTHESAFRGVYAVVCIPFPAAIPVTKLLSSKSSFHCHFVSLNPRPLSSDLSIG